MGGLKSRSAYSRRGRLHNDLFYFYKIEERDILSDANNGGILMYFVKIIKNKTEQQEMKSIFQLDAHFHLKDLFKVDEYHIIMDKR